MKFNIINIDSVNSTNSYAQNLISSRAANEGDVILTSYQESGRGQGSNTWESEHGSNLTFSVILQPHFIQPADQFVLTQIISLSIMDVVKGQLQTNDSMSVKVKWPNDIYVNKKKIAGILFQNFIAGDSIENSIVGIGLNINQKKFQNASNPVSLIHHVSEILSTEVILQKLLYRIDYRYEEQRIKQDFQLLKTEYMKNLYLAGEWSEFSDKTGIFSGKIVDIDEFGRLEIKIKSGNSRIYSFNEVTFI